MQNEFSAPPPAEPADQVHLGQLTERRRALASQVAELLAQRQLRLVLAESCTGGQAASSLTEVPGISQWWCGSWVTYRDQSKQQWLGIPAELIEKHSAVSPEVTAAMALLALNRTPEADLAATVTGHLGPHAPPNSDGQLFTAVQFRREPVTLLSHQLPPASRPDRLELATVELLTHVAQQLQRRS